MTDTIYPVSAYSGKTFRLLITDCHGAPLTSADVDSISYSIYKKEMGVRESAAGHSDVSVPLSSIFSELRTSPDSGKQFNFEYRVSGAFQLPFADYGEYYLVVFTFYVGAEPYSCTIQCLSE